MKKVIFLDFDGPLFPDKVLNYLENQKPQNEEKLKEINIHPFYTYWKGDSVCVSLLNELHKSGVKCVISSSWADDRMHTKNEIEKLFQENGINIELHEEWRTPRDKKDRSEQVSEWLKNNPVENYIILDDESSGKDFLNKTIEQLANIGIIKENIFIIDEANGINNEEYIEIINLIINKKTKELNVVTSKKKDKY